MVTPTAIVAYLALFVGTGFVFLFGNLLVGRLLRPRAPNVEKLEVYECGEPTIGSSFVQFDLRFYVVALLFIIFDVEVAFFFPWGNVHGKATHLMDPSFKAVEVRETSVASQVVLTRPAADLFRELGVPNPTVPPLSEAGMAALEARLGRTPTALEAGQAAVIETGQRLAALAIWDILVFFGVLMVGFAYVWSRGDLDWVRAIRRQRGGLPPRLAEPPPERQPAFTA
jgi:NADH-quinone oxidoreductase subunit A